MGKDPTYSVDDILLEYEIKQQKQPKAAPKASAKPTAPAKAPAAPVRTMTPPPTAVEKFKASAVPAAKTQPLQAVKPAAVKEQPQVAAHTRTRVLAATPEQEKNPTQELPTKEQLEGQLVLDHFVTQPVNEQELEEQLRQLREEKVKDFQLIKGGKPGFKLTGEEEEEPVQAEEPLDVATEDEEELEDFNQYAEAEAIRSEMAYRRRTGVIGLVATGVMELVLVAGLLLYQGGWLAAVMPTVLLAVNAALLIGMMGVNYHLMANGLKGFFTFHADADAPAAMTAVFGLIHTCLQYVWQDSVASGSAMLLTAVAGFGLLAGAFGRQLRTVRVARNFAFAGAQAGTKYAAAYIENDKAAAEIGRSVTDIGVPEVLYYQRASFLTHFLEDSYAEDFGDCVMRWYAPLSLAVAALCAGAYAWLFPAGAWQYAPTVFMSALCLATPVWGLAAMQSPMTRACKRVLRRGGMLCGWRSAEAFGDHLQSVVVDAQELFPAEQVKLHGIKTFSGTRIDEAITDAAAVVIAAGGPLSPIFHRVIENRTDMLQEVDSLAYEQDMGLSGWVGGRRVLVGNRRLLENHGVDVPSREYENRYTKDDRCTVYLSTGGELSAMFVVSYLADERIRAQLKTLQKEKITLLVHTCDPNVTVARLCRVMEMEESFVQVLSAAAGRAYEELKPEESVRAEALLAANGRAAGKICGLVQCSRLRKGGKASVISQLAGGIAGLAFSAFVSATTGMLIAPLYILGCFVLFGVVGRVVTACFRV